MSRSGKVTYDGDRWYDLQQVWCEAFEQATHAFSFDRLSRDVYYAGVCAWVADSTLNL